MPAKAPPYPEKAKVEEATTAAKERKESFKVKAEEARQSNQDLRATWAKAIKGKGKGKGKGKDSAKGKGKGKGKGKYVPKQEAEAARAEAIERLEKRLERTRKSSLKEMIRIEKGQQLKKPKFVKVATVMPEAKSLNIMLKCLKCTPIEGAELWEVVCGDETGVVTFSLRSKELVDICTPGASLRVQNAKSIMVKGFIRIIVDKWAVLKIAEKPLDFEVNTAHDISAVEYELAE